LEQVRCAGEEEEEEESSEADLTMEEVQGSVRMGAGFTVVLIACIPGRGEIGVQPKMEVLEYGRSVAACARVRLAQLRERTVGLSRGFLFDQIISLHAALLCYQEPCSAGAAATVVSLWVVHHGSIAALMKQMYKHLKDGRTTAQALRLAIMHLLEFLPDSAGPYGPRAPRRTSRWRRCRRACVWGRDPLWC